MTTLRARRALLELARAYAPAAGTTTVQTKPSHTLVFVSTDGGAFGALGAAHFAESSRHRDDAVAVISLDAIGGFGAPRLLIAGDTARSPAAALVRTAAVRVLEQSGSEPLRASALRQLLDLGFPFTLGEQGAFVARGIPALTLTTVPDGPSQGFGDTRLSGERLGELGRATQNLVGSLDAGLELTQGTTSYVYLGTRIVRGWAIEFVLLTALLPFADRRRRPLRALPPSQDRARAGGAQPAEPPALLGIRRPVALRRLEARRLSGRRATAAATRRRRLRTVAGRPRRARRPPHGRLADRPRAADSAPSRRRWRRRSPGTRSRCSHSVSSRSSSSRRIRSPSSTCCRRCTPGSGCPRPTPRIPWPEAHC